MLSVCIRYRRSTVDLFLSLHPSAHGQIVPRSLAAAKAWNELLLEPVPARIQLARYIMGICSGHKTMPFIPDQQTPPSLFGSPAVSVASSPRTPRSPIVSSNRFHDYSRGPDTHRSRSRSSTRLNAGDWTEPDQGGIIVTPSLYSRPIFLKLAIQLLPTPATVLQTTSRPSMKRLSSRSRSTTLRRTGTQLWRATHDSVRNILWPYLTLCIRLHLYLLVDKLFGPHVSTAETDPQGTLAALHGGSVYVSGSTNWSSTFSDEYDLEAAGRHAELNALNARNIDGPTLTSLLSFEYEVGDTDRDRDRDSSTRARRGPSLPRIGISPTLSASVVNPATLSAPTLLAHPLVSLSRVLLNELARRKRTRGTGGGAGGGGGRGFDDDEEEQRAWIRSMQWWPQLRDAVRMLHVFVERDAKEREMKWVAMRERDGLIELLSRRKEERTRRCLVRIRAKARTRARTSEIGRSWRWISGVVGLSWAQRRARAVWRWVTGR